MVAFLELLDYAGVEVTRNGNMTKVCGKPKRGIELSTGSYPMFPTDLVPQMIVFCTQANGKSSITELIYHHRFDAVMELKKMGAKIFNEFNVATIEGKKQLIGANVNLGVVL